MSLSFLLFLVFMVLAQLRPILKMTFDVSVGGTLPRETLLADLVALQYKRNDIAFARGDFRVRGDVIELFPAHYEDRAWRIELFGDEVDAITEFDPLTWTKNRRP